MPFDSLFTVGKTLDVEGYGTAFAIAAAEAAPTDPSLAERLINEAQRICPAAWREWGNAMKATLGFAL